MNAAMKHRMKSLRTIRAVVVNYRTPQLCIDLLHSLVHQRREGLSVAIVDNHSEDDSLERLAAAIEQHGWEQWVTLIASPHNSGFSGGNNLGLQGNDCDAFLLINSDTIMREGALDQLCSALEQDPRIGVVGPRLEWSDGLAQESCFRDFPPSHEFFAAARTGMLEGLFRYPNIAHAVRDSTFKTDWISFACVLIRAEVFRAVGMLDDGYFMYFDDADYCRLVRKAGFDVVYCPLARVVHLRGGSGPVKEASRLRKRRPRYWYASRSRYYAKWCGRRGLLAANLLWMAGRGVSLTREVLRLKQPHTCQAEWWDIWTNFTHPLKERAQ